MDLLALGEENLAKDLEENDKNWMILLCWVRERERKVEKTFEKVFWTGQTLNFKKPDSWNWIDWKIVSINRNR